MADINYIIKDFNQQKKQLMDQISSIELRCQDLQNYINMIDNSNNTLQISIQKETDNNKKNKYYSIIRQNVELLVKLYSTFREFEDTKFKYYNTVSDLLHKQHRLIEVDIRKIDSNIDDFDSGEFMSTLKKITSNLSKGSSDEIGRKLDTSASEYKL